MNRNKLLGLVGLTLIGSLFLLSQATKTDGPTILITEIGAFEQSGHEWIEIMNIGKEPTNLADWKFWEAEINHGLSLVSGSSTLYANDVAIIAQDADALKTYYNLTSTTIFDSSWGSLNESGEEIGLKDNEGAFVDLFTYPTTPNYSLERLIDPTTSTLTWYEHPSSSSIGSANY